MTPNNPKSGEKKDVLHETAEFVTVDSLMAENRTLRLERDRFKEIAGELARIAKSYSLTPGDAVLVAALRKELQGE